MPSRLDTEMQRPKRDDVAAPDRATVDDDMATAPLSESGAPSSEPSEATSGLRIPATGEIIASKYQVEEIVGRGGMGIVLAARHLQLRERVAIKILLVDSATRGTFQARFLREAQVTARLRNEHIARVIDVAALNDGTPYMVMELVDGVELRDILKRDGKLPIELAVDYVAQACEGLAEAHAHGIIHRDLKPPNLFLTHREDGSELVKILDFGISKLLSPTDQPLGERTETGIVLGSPRYMSPEQFATEGAEDAQSDVWALGAILYELLTGEPAFAEATFARLCTRVVNGDPPRSIREQRPEVPEALERAVMHALTRDREKRTLDVAELATEILSAIAATDATTRSAKIRATLARKRTGASGSRRTLSRSGETPSDRLLDARSADALSSSRVSASARDLVKQDAPRSRLGLVLGAVIVVLVGVVLGRELLAHRSASDVVASPASVAPATSVAPSGAPSTAVIAVPSTDFAGVATSPPPGATSAQSPSASVAAAAPRVTASTPSIKRPAPSAGPVARPAPSSSPSASPSSSKAPNPFEGRL